jgi:hypothetical protein
MTILDEMVRRRRFKAAYLLGSLLLLAASLHPPTAYSAPGDPPSGSPAGAVYQLPLEQGRSDAAPKGSGGTGTEAGGGGGGAGSGSASGQAGESGSLYRSENNFGSSSRVPGVAATGTGGGNPGNASGGAAGVGGAGVGGAAIVGGIVAAETADNGNTSIPASIVLLGAIALLAIAVGVLSRRYARRGGTSS